MSECRDWLKTLWASSFKGVPFYFESDDEEGGRDKVVHEFPRRNHPFIEDMGEAARYFSGAAYVHGDSVDSLESALKAALVSEGPGVLVVPLSGPIVVHSMTFKRHHEKDKLGYVAFEIKFVREGAASAQISIPFALNAAFGAADNLAAAISAVFAASVTALAEPDYVVAAAVDGVASAAAVLDVVRVSNRVEPAASAVIRDTLAGIVEQAPIAISPARRPAAAATELAETVVVATRALADALPADTAARVMIEVAETFGAVTVSSPYLSAAAARADANANAMARLARLAALTAYGEAMLRRTYAARPDGVTARAEVSARFEAELYQTDGAENGDLYRALDDLSGRIVEYLSRVINDLAPIVVVETARILPSLVLAWRLYGDPARGTELVARNSVRHPSFMPKEFLALSE